MNENHSHQLMASTVLWFVGVMCVCMWCMGVHVVCGCGVDVCVCLCVEAVCVLVGGMWVV